MNINSIRNKFELLKNEINGNTDILMISEKEFKIPFPTVNFWLKVSVHHIG